MKLILAFLLTLSSVFGQIVVINGGDQISASRNTINNNFAFLDTNKARKWTGSGAPGIISLSTRGDFYIDITPGTNNTYMCFALSCTAVGPNNWVLLAGGGGGGGASFTAITAGTNTTSLNMGAGGVLSYVSSGVINANKLLGVDITTITGMVKMASGVPSAAIADTDYSLPVVVVNDTNVTGSVSGHTITLGWTGTLGAGRLNSTVVESVVNDTNITGTISAQALTLLWSGTLAKGRMLATVVYTDQANTYGAFLQDFSSATMKIPVGAGSAPTANGQVAYDSSANQYKFGINGTSYAMAPFKGSFTNGDCLQYESATKTIVTFGAACNAIAVGSLPVFARTFYVPAAGCNNATAATSMDLPTTSAATPICVTGTNTQKGALQYVSTAATVSSAQYHVRCPAGTSGLMDFNIEWTTAGTSGNMKWFLGVATTATNATATDDPSFSDTTATTAAPGTANRVQTTAIAGVTACSAGQDLHIRIKRDTNDGADTLGSAVNLIGIENVIRVQPQS